MTNSCSPTVHRLLSTLGQDQQQLHTIAAATVTGRQVYDATQPRTFKPSPVSTCLLALVLCGLMQYRRPSKALAALAQ